MDTFGVMAVEIVFLIVLLIGAYAESGRKRA